MQANRVVGVLLVVGSAALFALAGVFTKLVSADVWAIAGWRGLVGSIVTAGYFFWRRRRAGIPISLRLGPKTWLFGALSIATQLLYIGALKYTYVSNVAVIYAIAPFVAALLALLMLGERFRLTTMITALISLGGVIVIVGNGLNTGNVLGDAMALAMTFTFALYMIAVRAFSDQPVLWAVAVASFLLFLASFFTTEPLMVSWADMGYLVLFGLTFSSAVILFTEGASRLPVAETALIGTLDVPFAVGFAWLFLAEIPPASTILGGLIVVGALLFQALMDVAGARWQAWRALRGRSQPTPPVISGGGDR